ncbi:GIY-YIG nuclease family protein [Pseudomonas sp. SIMBA_067]|uniref:GIY-YIG nuclease family protein n=1 Tax=Pseudomonas sp. SIMBA_067 TaxID=3085807 RepID=UPI00397D3616
MTSYRTCIYQIRNLVSGKTYIGSASNYPVRKSVHLNSLRGGRHRNRHLQSAYDKYGESSLEFSKILICEKRDLLFYEQRAIDCLAPEYNIHRVAGSPAGYSHSPETIEKMKSAWANRPADIREKIAAADRSGERHTEKSRRAIADHQRSRVRGDSERRKIALSVGMFTEAQVLLIRELRSAGAKLSDLAARFNTSSPVISNIANRKTYRWL